MKLDAPDLFMLILAVGFFFCLGLGIYFASVSGSACTEAHYKQIKLESCGDKDETN